MQVLESSEIDAVNGGTINGGMFLVGLLAGIAGAGLTVAGLGTPISVGGAALGIEGAALMALACAN